MISAADLRPGVLLRWTSGHHPGAVVRVVRVKTRAVEIEAVRGGPARSRRLGRWDVNRDRLLKMTELEG